MRLIGMLDSPYVRRVAVSLHLLGLPFALEQVSVFRDYDQFETVNPVVKAPSLVTDGGVVLMDSTLILDYLDRLVPQDRRLTPEAPDAYLRSQRIIGLALAACEKTVQLIYELNLRPEEKQHAPWMDRVKGQLATAYALLEAELPAEPVWLCGRRPMQADITAAVAWGFTQFRHPELAEAEDFPRLAALSARAEALAPFVACSLDGVI